MHMVRVGVLVAIAVAIAPAVWGEGREAAPNDDPVALTERAAALLDKDVIRTYGELLQRLSSKEDFSSYKRPLEAIALLQRAIERKPDLSAAHFNLALALVRIGFTADARAQFEEAIRVSGDLKWNKEVRQRAKALGFFDQQLERGRVRAYMEVTGRADARRVLRPYLEAQKMRLARARRPAHSDSRLLFAAHVYRHRLDYIGDRLLRAMQTFCSDGTVEPCATRYYIAGALYAAGRKSEAASWLGSIEAEVQRAHGNSGLSALWRWEEGLNLYVRGMPRQAFDVLEAQYVKHQISGQRALAAEFDHLRRTVRGYLVSHDPVAAFEFADGSSLREIQSALAADAAIIRYAPPSDHRIGVSVVRKNTFDVVTLYHDQSHAGIEYTAARMRNAAAAAAQLHDLVVAPLLEKLEGISTIAVVRNKELADIPFGALFDVNRGQYLAERFTIVHARSAGDAVALSKRARKSHDSTLLAIGATHTGRERLAGVDREIADITAQSLCARVVAGKDATPEAIQRALTENAVIHYGGHIAQLRLLLAPSRGRDGLSAQEIARLRMDKARVVVLAGCRGAASEDAHRTVADAFLMAGVPTVIATSYDLDDAEAPPTMRLLHTFLRDGDDAAVALRKTTLAELRSGRGVPLSVRFQAVGGTRGLIR